MTLRERNIPLFYHILEMAGADSSQTGTALRANRQSIPLSGISTPLLQEKKPGKISLSSYTHNNIFK